MRQERGELSKVSADYGDKYSGYMRIKKLIEDI